MQEKISKGYIFTTNESSELVMIKQHKQIADKILAMPNIVGVYNKQPNDNIVATLNLVGNFKIMQPYQMTNFIKEYEGTEKFVLIFNNQSKSLINNIEQKLYCLIDFFLCFPCSCAKGQKYIRSFNILHFEQSKMLELLVLIQSLKKKNNKFLTGFYPLSSQRVNLLHRSIYNGQSQKKFSNTNLNFILEKFKNLIEQMPDQNNKKNSYELFKKLFNEKRSSVIIQHYTKQSIVFSFINNFLRLSSHPSHLLYIEPYLMKLFEAIRSLFIQQLREKFLLKNTAEKSAVSYIFYRGGYANHQQISMFLMNKGEYIQNICFLSTSERRQTAEQFEKNILYVIQANLDADSYHFCPAGFAWIKEFSEYPQEEEVLFNPLCTFYVKDVETVIINNRQKHRVYLNYGYYQSLFSPKQAHDQLSQKDKINKLFFQRQRKEAEQIQCQGDILLSNSFICKQGLQQYLERSAQMSKTLPIQQKSKTIYESCLATAIACRKAGNFLDARKFYEQCLPYAKEIYGYYSLEHFQLINDIATLMQLDTKQEEVVSMYEKARSILRMAKNSTAGEIKKQEHFLDGNIIAMEIRSAGGVSKSVVLKYTQLLKLIKKEQDYQFHYFALLLNLPLLMTRKSSRKAKKFLKSFLLIAQRSFGKDDERYRYLTNELEKIGKGSDQAMQEWINKYSKQNME